MTLRSQVINCLAEKLEEELNKFFSSAGDIEIIKMIQSSCVVNMKLDGGMEGITTHADAVVVTVIVVYKFDGVVNA